MFTRLSPILLFLLVLGCPMVHADEVLLEDGSTIVGTITGLKDGVLSVDTKHAGTLAIQMDGVQGISTKDTKGLQVGDSSPRNVQFKVEGDQQLVVGGDGTTEPIALGELTLLWPGDQEMPKPAPLWTGRIELGMTGTDGNSERLNFVGLSEGTRDTDANRLRLFLQGYYAEDDGERTQNEFKGGGRYDWKLENDWSAYMSLGLEHDEFEALDLRTTVVFGMGNQLLDSKKQSLNARLGLGYQHENFEVGDDEGEAILDLGYDYALVLGKWAKLRQDTTYQSGLDAPLEEYRIIANTGLELPLASDQAWRVRTGVKHEYDDEPLPGIERLDTTYYLNLAYDW